MKTVRRNLHKVHIGSFRLENGIPAQPFAFFCNVNGVHIVHEFHEVACSGIEEVTVFYRCDSFYVYHFQAHGPGRFFASLRMTWRALRMTGGTGEDCGGVGAVGGEEEPGAVGGGGGEAEHVGKSHNAAAAVTAHHAAGAVGVVEFHGEVGGDSSTALGMTGGAGVQYHETVGVVFAAEFGYAGGVAVLLHVAAAAVKDDEVVPGTGENI